MIDYIFDIIRQIRLVEIIEFIGTFAFAISGVRGAATKKCDWFGAFVLGFVTAVGGGTFRDLLLGVTPFWMMNSIYVWCTLSSLLFYIFLREHLNHLNRFFFWSDSIGLGLFVVVGAEKAMILGYDSWVIVTMGTITAVLGGVIRDILLNKVPLIFKREIYASPCIVGGIFFVTLQFFNLNLPLISAITIGIVTFLRYVAVKWDLQIPKLKSEKSN